MRTLNVSITIEKRKQFGAHAKRPKANENVYLYISTISHQKCTVMYCKSPKISTQVTKYLGQTKNTFSIRWQSHIFMWNKALHNPNIHTNREDVALVNHFLKVHCDDNKTILNMPIFSDNVIFIYQPNMGH